MAMQLEGVFGAYARIIFCVGFGTAAFSSFVTNALIGGVLVSDGLGLGGKVNSSSTKLFATIILLIGLATAVAILQSEAPADPAAAAGASAKSQLEIRALALAQALTLLAVPLGVLATLLAFFDRDAMAQRPFSTPERAFVVLGAAVLLGIAGMTALRVVPMVGSLLQG